VLSQRLAPATVPARMPQARLGRLPISREIFDGSEAVLRSGEGQARPLQEFCRTPTHEDSWSSPGGEMRRPQNYRQGTGPEKRRRGSRYPPPEGKIKDEVTIDRSGGLRGDKLAGFGLTSLLFQPFTPAKTFRPPLCSRSQRPRGPETREAICDDESWDY
jgi:hypothetical protein